MRRALTSSSSARRAVARSSSSPLHPPWRWPAQPLEQQPRPRPRPAPSSRCSHPHPPRPRLSLHHAAPSLPHYRDWAHPSRITGTGLTPLALPGLGSPLPHYRDRARPATSAPGLASPLPCLHWNHRLRVRSTAESARARKRCRAVHDGLRALTLCDRPSHPSSAYVLGTPGYLRV